VRRVAQAIAHYGAGNDNNKIGVGEQCRKISMSHNKNSNFVLNFSKRNNVAKYLRVIVLTLLVQIFIFFTKNIIIRQQA
jgi:hypothetical protein